MKFFIGLMCLGYSFLTCAAPMGVDINISNAWVRAAPPAVKMMAGYLTIANHSSKDLKLTSISSDVFGFVEVHRSYLEDGFMKMAHVGELVIKKGDKVILEPASYHLMLMAKKKPLKIGDLVKMTLYFDDSMEKTVIFEVRKQ